MSTEKKNTIARLLLGFFLVASARANAGITFYPAELGSFSPANQRGWESFDPTTTGAICSQNPPNCVGFFQLDLSTPGVLTTRLTVPQGKEIMLTPGSNPRGIAIAFNFLATNVGSGGSDCENLQVFNQTAITTSIKGSQIGGLAYKPVWIDSIGAPPRNSFVSMDSCQIQMVMGFDGPATDYYIEELL